MKRRGFSLIECLTMITIGAILITSCYQMIEQTYASSHQAARWVRVQRGVNRLSLQFRREVRNATSVESPTPNQLVIIADTKKITYNVSEDQILWKLEVDGSLEAEDRFWIPGASAQFSLSGNGVVEVEIQPFADHANRNVLILQGRQHAT